MSVYCKPKDKISDLSQFKVFADNKKIVTKKLKFVVGRLENIVGKRENAERQHFPAMFSKGSVCLEGRYK